MGKKVVSDQMHKMSVEDYENLKTHPFFKLLCSGYYTEKPNEVIKLRLYYTWLNYYRHLNH